MSRILVTGANGFVGRAVCRDLRGRGRAPRIAVRRNAQEMGDVAAVGDIDGRTDWSLALSGIDCILRLAARAYVTDDSDSKARVFRQGARVKLLQDSDLIELKLRAHSPEDAMRFAWAAVRSLVQVRQKLVEPSGPRAKCTAVAGSGQGI